MSFWNLVAELGMPIAATVGLGAFIMVIIKYILGSVVSTTHALSQWLYEDVPWAHPRTKIGTQIWSQCECTLALQRLSSTAHTPPVRPSALVGV